MPTAPTPPAPGPSDAPTAVLLSGGVDSSVALHRVLERSRRLGGPAPVAFYLKIWLEDELAHLGHCPWEDDLRYARQVCDDAGIELEVVPLQRRYHELVVDWAIAELRAGRTPSPDILCNQRVKFGAFVDVLDELGTFSTVASGHYARLDRGEDGRTRLLRGRDPVKDQTYFLFELDQRQLSRAEFPIGALTKAEVRQEAHRLGLANRDRPDSQGICFLGKLRFEDFVRAHLGDRPGPIRQVETGKMLGEHRGHWFHTIGQRKGLGLGGGPWYVVAKEPPSDTLWVCHGTTLDQHGRRRFHVPAVHWIAESPRNASRSGADRATPDPVGSDGAASHGAASDWATTDWKVRVRHGPRLADARVEWPGPGGSGLALELAEADPGIAPGQVAVLYRGETCLGGGQIALELQTGRAEPAGETASAETPRVAPVP